MKREEIRICVLRTGGTNCDSETKRALCEVGANAEVVHTNEVLRKKNLFDYDAIVLPGGFSYGDYVRAGAIWAKLIVAKLGDDLKRFVKLDKPILGICNGFQVLVEAGLLPAFDGMTDFPEAALATNTPPGYNCRWINLKHESKGKCIFTSQIPSGKVIHVPVAHSEGRFILPKDNEMKILDRLRENDQLVFRYCDSNGRYADGLYPTNPNGSFYDIAGICNPEGTVFGLMPHPERAFYCWQQPEWTRQKQGEYGDGRTFFESLIQFLAKEL